MHWLLLASLLALAACAGTPRAEPAVVQPAARMDDVAFMQGMIAHHAQALDMTRLVADRTAREDMKLLAERMAVSQRDEIRRMRAWLDGKVSAESASHTHQTMPGMLTAAELARLEVAKGTQFDSLFLELMIRHHEGALTMVRQLFDTPEAARDPLVYMFATDIDADQRAEIARMRNLFDHIQRGSE